MFLWSNVNILKQLMALIYDICHIFSLSCTPYLKKNSYFYPHPSQSVQSVAMASQ